MKLVIPRALVAVALALGSLVAGATAAGATTYPDIVCVDADFNLVPCPRPLPNPCVIGRSPFRPCPPCPRPFDVGGDILRPCPPVPPKPTPQPGPAVPGLIEARDLTAFVDAQPGPGTQPRLIVTATLVLASPGFSVALVPTEPQGVNGDILLLDLIVKPPTLFQAQVVTEVQVRFESTQFTGVSEVNVVTLGLQVPVTVVR